MIITALLFYACSQTPKPTAISVCEGLVTSGVARAGTCKSSNKAGLTVRAKERIEFLSEMNWDMQKGGQVLSFADKESFTLTFGAFNEMRNLVGKHLYNSQDKLIIVQLNSGEPDEFGKKVQTFLRK